VTAGENGPASSQAHAEAASPDGGETADSSHARRVSSPGDFAEFARTRDRALRDGLVTQNLGLANQLARRFANRGETPEDLAQVASLALVKAVDRFDPERGVEFATFAARTIVGELKRHFRDKGWAIRAPRRVQELYLELGHVVAEKSQELGRSPTVAELAEATGATEEAVLEALEAGQGYRTTSIDVPDRQDETLASHLGTEDATFAIVDDRSALAPAMATLPARQQKILRLRFVDGLTQSEIAAQIGVSQMHVSRLLASSLTQLRMAIADQA
jgi:RNA polymerase sigma-B factor